MEPVVLSKFAHQTTNNGITAYYYSLRMRPIFIPTSLNKYISQFEQKAEPSRIIKSADTPSEGKLLDKSINALKEAKILVRGRQEDEYAIDYFRGIIGKPHIGMAYFMLTDQCNFSCDYCFIRNHFPKEYQEISMSEETALQGLKFFHYVSSLTPCLKDQKKSIVFYGGEPLMNTSTLRFILESISHNKEIEFSGGLDLAMVTNGSLITPRVVELLKAHSVGVGISIDGDELLTSYHRSYQGGRPVFHDIVRGFRLCQDAGINPGVSCTLSPESVQKFDTVMEVLLDKLQVTNLGFNVLLLDKQQNLPDWYFQRAAECMISAFQVFRDRGIYEDRIMRKARAFIEGKVYPFDCGACGGGQIVIAPDGQVGICHGYMGSRKFFPTDIHDMEFNPRQDEIYLEWARRSPLNISECQDCMALGICGGGCPLQAETDTGSIWGLDERFCIHAKQTLEWLIWDLYEKTTSQ